MALRTCFTYKLSCSSHQTGMALIVVVFLISLAATAFLANTLNASTVKIERDKKTTKALAEAKAAIIGWSSRKTTLSQLGQLPCPEDTTLIGTANEGTALTSCTSVNPVIGRLPWRTLGLEDLRDGNGERLWYVISPGFRSTSTINSDTVGQLTVDGIANSAVAIIFSSGYPLNGQIRPIPTAATPPDITQYLDLSNSDGSYSFISTSLDANFNDKLMPISHDDFFRAIEKRVAGEALNCLKDYALNDYDSDGITGTYPWPNALDTALLPTYTETPGTLFGRFPDNPSGNWSGCLIPLGGTGWWTAWKELVFFALADGYKPGTPVPACGASCLTVSPISTLADKQVVVLVAGKSLPGQGQSRTNTPADKGTLSNYLENTNNLGGTSFIQQTMTSTFNDVVVYQ